MTNDELLMIDRIVKYLQKHDEVRNEIQSRLFPNTRNLDWKFQRQLTEHLNNWTPDIPREKSVARLIHENTQNGLYDLTIPSYEKQIVKEEIEKIEKDERLNFLKKKYDEFPKYIELNKVEWVMRYFEDSFKIVNEWEQNGEIEKYLIKLRNERYLESEESDAR